MNALFKSNGHLYGVEVKYFQLTSTYFLKVKRLDEIESNVVFLEVDKDLEYAIVEFFNAEGLIERQEEYDYSGIDLDSKDWLESFGRWCVACSDI